MLGSLSMSAALNAVTFYYELPGLVYINSQDWVHVCLWLVNFESVISAMDQLRTWDQEIPVCSH